MKKAAIILVLFALFTLAVCKITAVTDWDTAVIVYIQQKMSVCPDWIKIFTGKKIYNVMIYTPIIIGSIFFIIKKLYHHIPILIAAPYIAYGFNIIFKNIIARPRPPIELQIGYHSASFSYVSNHTIIMMCLWGIIIFYVNRYCKNNILKRIITVFSVIWILFSGFSRIWLGVHNPTDVIGAYILGSLFLVLYIKTAKIISKRFE